MTNDAALNDASFYNVVRAYTTPDENEEDMREAVDELMEESDARLEALLDEGFALFARRPPAVRLAGYLAETLPEDVPIVTDPRYLELRKTGLRLRAEELLEQQALMPPEQIEVMPPVPNLWPLILRARDIAFVTLARDFRELLHAEERRNGRGAEPPPA
mgnify:CR=1 FL=1